MIKTVNHYFLGLAVLCLFACEKVDDVAFPEDRLIERKDFVLTRSDLDFIQANNGFAFELFKRVAAIEKGKSTLISPLSVTIDFGVVNNGTAGETRDEINRVLGYREGSVEGLNAFCQSMLVQSAEVDPTTTLNIANAAVVNSIHPPLKESFSKTVQSVYDEEIFYMEFGRDDVKGFINQWCSEKTNGMIPEFLDYQPHPVEYAHFLNAVYFKGIWSDKFDKKDTKKETFTREDGSRTSVRMMWQKDKFNLGGVRNVYTSLCLPYGNQAYRMILLLPYEGKSIEDVKDALNAETWNSMVKEMRGFDVDVKLPVFETTTNLLHLKGALREMGIRKAFDMDAADFSALTDSADYPFYIGDVLHKARIKVDETGSEAAAITDISIMTIGIHVGEPPVVEFHCDRPFLYVITEVSSGAIYFIGQYTGE